MKQFTFFIFTEREGFQLGNAYGFLFSLTFTYCENSEIKVTVKLIGSTVLNLVLLTAEEQGYYIAIALL